MAPPKPKTPPSDADAPADVQTPAPAATRADWPADEFAGLGGDYVRDPVTGVRTRVPTQSPDADPAAS